MIRVRRVVAEDWPRLKQVRLAALADAPSAFGSTYERETAFGDDEWIERARLGAEGTQRATFFAVDEHDEIVGIVGGFEYDGVTDLVSMWTSPAARGRGVGAQLVDAVIAWAGERTLHLWVTDGNDAAHSLYRGAGFVETGDAQPHPNDPCKDEIRMVRQRQMESPNR